jgi:YHS domain-containing protein
MSPQDLVGPYLKRLPEHYDDFLNFRGPAVLDDAGPGPGPLRAKRKNPPSVTSDGTRPAFRYDNDWGAMVGRCGSAFGRGRFGMKRVMACVGIAAGMLAMTVRVRAEDEGTIPESLAPFEYLIGGWKGTGIEKAKPLKGWPERHQWAWKFAKGVPVGLSVSFEGDKFVTQAQLTYDAKAKRYRLEGKDAAGKPVVFTGKLDPKGRLLTLDRDPTPTEGKQRLTIRLLPENRIRYVVWVDRQPPGTPRFARFAEVGLTREGESFAASGGSEADRPKCIVTGGTATLTVSYQGQTFPICCTGCRDEFLESPDKYLKKAALRAEKQKSKGEKKPAPSAAPDDGSFDNLITTPKADSKDKQKGK